jgi:hypothetical protein
MEKLRAKVVRKTFDSRLRADIEAADLHCPKHRPTAIEHPRSGPEKVQGKAQVSDFLTRSGKLFHPSLQIFVFLFIAEGGQHSMRIS